MAELGPKRAHRRRKHQWKRLEKIAARLQEEDDKIKASLDEGVRDVLEAAGNTGSHLAFLDFVLKESEYPQRKAVMRDLRGGFPLVGLIPVEKTSRSRVVQRRSKKPHELPRGRVEWEKTRRTHEAMATSNDPSVNQEIMDQTVADQKLGRISSFYTPDESGPVPTRRFGVKQETSDGREKTRCIDDAKASSLNDLISVIGRLRMGRIKDVEIIAKRMQRQCKDEDILFWQSDFSSAYRCLPLRPEERHLLQVLVWDEASER